MKDKVTQADRELLCSLMGFKPFTLNYEGVMIGTRYTAEVAEIAIYRTQATAAKDARIAELKREKEVLLDQLFRQALEPNKPIADGEVREMVEDLRRGSIVPEVNHRMEEAAQMLERLQAKSEMLEKFNNELRRYMYDKTPDRREEVCKRFL